MTDTSILEAFNIIELFNIVLPAGSGEIITLMAFMGFFFVCGLFFIVWALTRDITLNHLRAKTQIKNVGLIPLPGGRTIHVLLDPKQSDYKYTDNMRWLIKPDEFTPFSNGVNYTILHPDLGHNVSISSLVNFYTGETVQLQDETGQIHDMPVRKLIYSARMVASGIHKIANMEAAKLLNNEKRMAYAMMGIGVILAVAVGGAIILAMLPERSHEIIPIYQNITTTTIPAVSGIN